ncbi:RING/U-box superfamily protein [Abeliophyllum distichum]|uniref:RING/U-box superfamily protein n=1 Tax=Abeliophyllum distichum TaxID=126358 RepID=A0ABD1U4Z4_9LAMI
MPTTLYVDGMPTASSEERKATLQEFYSVIFPSLNQLEGNLMELTEDNFKKTDILRPRMDPERECGLCMEMGSKVVLPNCGHSMCIGCFHDWYVPSHSVEGV